MEDKNISNSHDSAENEKINTQKPINFTVQEFVILGLCLILTAVIVICNCVYAIPVATVETTYAASSITMQTNAIEMVTDVTDVNYTEESTGETFSSNTSTQTSISVSATVKETAKSSTQQSSVAQVASSSSAASSTGLININTAGVTALCTLNGIGEIKAKEIIAHRENNGAFTNIEQLKDVKGIADAIFNKIKDYVTIE